MTINIGIVGATGYVGEELVSIVDSRDDLNLAFVSSFSNVGSLYKDLFPDAKNNLSLKSINDIPENLDYIFFATKHDFSMDFIPKLLDKGVKVIDLSADFRLSNSKLWQETYSSSHRAEDKLTEAIYGLPEYSENKIKNASLVAVPGCYPTASLLGLLPIAPFIKKDSKIILDAKSGMSGAGRAKVEENLEKDLHENFKAYNVDFHRHQPEIKDFLQNSLKMNNEIIFIPHLLPLFRGEYVTIYCEVDNRELELIDLYKSFYKNDEYIRIKNRGEVAEIKDVIKTNYCDISLSYAFKSNMVVINSAIDNLLKGAASQAIQCLDIMID